MQAGGNLVQMNKMNFVEFFRSWWCEHRPHYQWINCRDDRLIAHYYPSLMTVRQSLRGRQTVWIEIKAEFDTNVKLVSYVNMKMTYKLLLRVLFELCTLPAFSFIYQHSFYVRWIPVWNIFNHQAAMMWYRRNISDSHPPSEQIFSSQKVSTKLSTEIYHQTLLTCTTTNQWWSHQA